MKKPLKKAKYSSSTPATPDFPMRINKYLAHKGYSTRRGADEIIQKRWVTINNRVAVLGDKVNATDMVEVRNNKKAEDYAYYVYNKSRGVSTDSIPAPRGMFPVLGLDVSAEGLVIFTNDRRIVDRLTNPVHEHMKEYIIRTIQPLRANFKEKMEQGVVVNGSEPITCTINVKKENLFTLHLTDTGSRIRQMCSLFGAEIETMKRTKILNIDLGTLPANDHREIKDEELSLFLKTLGL